MKRGIRLLDRSFVALSKMNMDVYNILLRHIYGPFWAIPTDILLYCVRCILASYGYYSTRTKICESCVGKTQLSGLKANLKKGEN